MELAVLSIIALVVLVIVGTFGVRYVRRLYHRKYLDELGECHSVGLEMKAGFEAQLLAVASSVVRRPTRVYASVEPNIESWSFRRRRSKILLRVTLSAVEDFPIVDSTADQFIEQFLAKPGNRKYATGICYQAANVPHEGLRSTEK